MMFKNERIFAIEVFVVHRLKSHVVISDSDGACFD